MRVGFMEPLDAMDRLCDHMLESWYVPVLTKTEVVKDKKGNETQKITDDMTLLDKLMAFSEQIFEDLFPESPPDGVPEGEIGATYFSEVEKVFEKLKDKAQNLSFCDAKCRVLVFKGYYDALTNAYEIFDINLRPCVWETGLIRQLTNYAVNALRQASEANNVSLRFRCSTGSSYLVSMTMEDEPTIFKDESKTLSNEFVFSIPPQNFEKWDTFYGKSLDDIYKFAWITGKLKTDARFNAVKKKFRDMNSARKKYLDTIIKTKKKVPPKKV